MTTISSFRGMTGEVIKSYLRISIFFTSIPIFLIWGFFIIYMMFLGNKIPAAVSFLIMWVINVLLIARFVIPASRGAITTGFFNSLLQRGEVFRYAGRFILLTLTWFIPIAIIIWLVFGNLQDTMMEMFLSDLNFNSLSYAGWHGLVLIIFSLLIPILFIATIIMTANTESLVDLFNLDQWRWFFGDRLGDLIPLLASAISGFMMFWVVYIIPFIVIDILCFKISANFGAIVAGTLYLVPFICMPVLLGRLGGAFIYGEGEMDISYEEYDNNADTTIVQDALIKEALNHQTATSGAAAVAIPPTTQAMVPEKLPGFNDIINRIRNLSEAEVKSEISQIEAKKQTQTPLDILTIVEYAFLLKKDLQAAESIKVASEAIHACLDNNIAHYAIDIYRGFIKDRTQLSFDVAYLNLLLQALLNKQQFLDAGWCAYMLCSQPNQDISALQKRFLTIADQALKANRRKDAVALYQFFLKKLPESTFNDSIQQILAVEEKKLKNQMPPNQQNGNNIDDK